MWMRFPAVRERPLIRRLALLLLVVSLSACERDDMRAPDPDRDDSVAEIIERITGPGAGDAVHFVRLVQRGDRYAFDPSELTIPRGDVVRFLLVGGKPESIVFDAGEATPEAAAFIRENALDLGVLLTEPGQAFDASFRDAPAGRYPFRSLPRTMEGMRGVVVVTDRDGG
jgi:plastocyanin